MTQIDYTADRLDSRDLLDRLEELEATQDEIGFQRDDSGDDMQAELDMLRALRDETEGYADDSWRDGVFFVANWDWKNYAQELADEMGAIPKEYSWPASYIDWDAAARDLRMDYMPCEIDGNTYWYR